LRLRPSCLGSGDHARVVLNSISRVGPEVLRVVLNSISSGCTRDVSEKGYTAASRRTSTEALARPRRRCGGPLPRTIGLGTYSSVVRWLPPPTFSTHLLPSERGPFSVGGMCARGVCASCVSQPKFHSSRREKSVALKRSKETQLLPPLPPSWTSTARISTQLRPAQRS